MYDKWLKIHWLKMLLLPNSIAEDVHQQQVNTLEFDQKIQAALSRQPDATIWQHKRSN